MGRINITLAIDSNDMVLPMEVDEDATMASLKEQAEGISGIPAAKQVLLREGKPITAAGSIKGAGMADGDVIMLVQQQQQQARQPGAQQQSGQAQNNTMATNQDGSFMYPEQVIETLRNSPEALANLRQRAPAVAAAIERGDMRELQQTMRQMHLQNQLPDDPMDPEYQRRAMEAIQQQAIDENYENAMEHSPEMFGQVEMLYVDMTANGEPLKVFVDSGAQMTIMTQTCAEKCNLMRLVDKRFAGMAVGVGSSKISGRIHACNLKVGDQFITTSVTVLEQKNGPQCIFGLDNMRRHQCCIDLPANALRIGTCGVSLPFLPEHDVPKDFNTSRQLDNEKMDNTADATAGASPKGATSSGTLPAPVNGATAGPSTDAVQGSLPAAAPTPAQPSSAAPSPAAGGAAPSTDGADEEAVKQLMNLTGQSAEQCREALKAAGNNVDAAASMLMGF